MKLAMKISLRLFGRTHNRLRTRYRHAENLSSSLQTQQKILKYCTMFNCLKSCVQPQ